MELFAARWPLGDLLKAHLAPVRSELERLSAEVTELRRTLPPMLVTLREAGDWPVRRDGGGSS